jgi:hypothetical protein
MWYTNEVGREVKFLANTGPPIIRVTCSIHVCNRVSIETDSGRLEPLFNSPDIRHIRTVSRIHVYFPDPGNDKSVNH